MQSGGVIYDPEFLKHGSEDHREKPERARAIRQALAASPLESQLRFIDPRPASDREVERVHPPEYAAMLDKFCAAGGGWIDEDTYLSPDSARIARLAAGSAARAVEAVVREGFPWVFSICRPPGHHATPNTSMGFCLLNNAAVAARHAQQALGLERVAIIDWDVHHGNGTQDIFYTDPSVLFFSIHQFPIWPGTGRLTERGDGAGLHRTVNVPLPPGMGNAEYHYAFDEVLRPAVLAFQPQLVIVSAGFDAHDADPLGDMRITAEGFARLATQVQSLAQETPAQGRLVALLEGGYNVPALAESAVAVMGAWHAASAALAENDPDRVQPPARSVVEEIKKLPQK